MRSLHDHVFCKLAGVDKEALLGTTLTAAGLVPNAALGYLQGAGMGAHQARKREIWDESKNKKGRRPMSPALASALVAGATGAIAGGIVGGPVLGLPLAALFGGTGALGGAIGGYASGRNLERLSEERGR